jgi:uncharacterized repeat protein (TIGR04076 family)
MSDSKTTDRRGFLSACGLAGAALAGMAAAVEAQQPPLAAPPPAAIQPQLAPPRRRYQIGIEIVECKAGKCARHTLGDKFAYPADQGRMCEWLQDSMSGAVRVLEYGGTMPWLYEGTPYKKVIDPDGVTTEFIRCPDPTDSGVVVKITRTRV